METIRIDILNPKAKALLKDLANLDLIRIRKEDSENAFSEILKKFRSKSDEAPSLEEITKEVEAVRKVRYEK
ncbi:hypothetical protein [Cecembia rubra]|uniref:hypothetical protein n=1 Tax=Cecembia rubra TaxID=1485585 RepID=UPI002714D35C|nr:hypothetical protein [Cecembia rubra]